MKKQVLTVTSIAAALLLLWAQTMPVLAAGPAKASPQAKWTFMVYMNGDNNLEKYVTSDIETELARPGSNADVKVVALADRIPGYNKSAGDWTSTKLFYITPG